MKRISREALEAMFVAATLFAVLFFCISWHTAKQLQKEKAAHEAAVQKVRDSFWGCQPSVYLQSENPVDAVSVLDYRDSQYGRACVFLPSGKYGMLWYSKVIEGQKKAHLEWQFQELGKYQW